jgi:cell division protein FtsQ
MWQKPHLLTAVSDLLFLAGAAALLVAAVVWGAPRLRLFPLSEVQVTHELREVQRSELEESLAELLRGNFFTVDIESVRQSLEGCPGCGAQKSGGNGRHVSRFASRSSRRLHTGAMGRGSWSIPTARSFRPRCARAVAAPAEWAGRFFGEVLRRYEEFAQLMKPVGRLPAQVALSPRLAWLVKLEDGMWIELGREQPKAPIRMRLQRFVDYYPTLSDTRGGRPTAVDMRYPNGFALRFPASAVQEVKGKK